MFHGKSYNIGLILLDAMGDRSILVNFLRRNWFSDWAQKRHFLEEMVFCFTVSVLSVSFFASNKLTLAGGSGSSRVQTGFVARHRLDRTSPGQETCTELGMLLDWLVGPQTVWESGLFPFACKRSITFWAGSLCWPCSTFNVRPCLDC